MAGAGSRFEKAGYTFPKPLIEVRNKPMIQVVVDNINVDAQFIFIVQKAHLEKYNLTQTLNLIAPNCKIVFSEQKMSSQDLNAMYNVADVVVNIGSN